MFVIFIIVFINDVFVNKSIIYHKSHLTSSRELAPSGLGQGVLVEGLIGEQGGALVFHVVCLERSGE
jgi:hypothetical protein